MNIAVLPRPPMYLWALLLLGGCAAPGPSYEVVMANALPTPDDGVRIVFLRPKDADDGSNGGGASIEVNQARVGGVAGAATVPNVYGGAGAAVATSASGVAAGSAAATAVESAGKRCRGPYKLEPVAEEDALPRLADLTWSGD